MVSPLTLFELLASKGLVYSTLLVRLSKSPPQVHRAARAGVAQGGAQLRGPY